MMTDADFRRVQTFGAERVPDDVQADYDARQAFLIRVAQLETDLTVMIGFDPMEIRALARRLQVRADNALRNADMQEARERAKK